MRRRSFAPHWTLLLGLAALFGIHSAVHAQGILYPRPEVTIQPFYVSKLHVNTVINDAVAETTVEQTFVNTSSVPQEGTYLYPLPDGAAPTSFSMTIGDRTLEPRILTHDEARSIYESIVRRRRDPALLEYVDRSLIRVSVFPIPPKGERIIRLRYTEVLKPESGMHKYAYSLSTSRFGSRPVGVATVSIHLQTQAALKNVYSPTHDLSIRHPDDHTATASWEGRDDASDRDLALYFSTGDDDVGLSLLTYKSGESDGYFMLLASPRVAFPKPRILPKQIVFVLDRTGSMSGAKIQQARKSLLYCLNSLHPQDRFDVITFNESPDILMRHLEPATEANIAKARRFVQDIEASGGTNIDDALHAALNLLKDEDGRQKMVVFLTDGLPTVGETNINTILRHVRDLNGGKHLAAASASDHRVHPAGLDNARRPGGEPERATGARIFCFGLGYDVNVPFLDRLADLGRGDADYVKPEEDIEVKVSAFFSKVSSPVLSDLRLAFDGADVYDVYPQTLPDLFKGSQLVITGRFRGEGGGTVRLAGLANDTQETFHLASAFGEANGRNSYLPRIWAARKIGYLVDQVRLSDDPAGRNEIIDEIVRLSHDYGIITEYTSFLVDEQEQTALGGRDGIRAEVYQRAMQYGISGPAATDQSLRAKTYQQLGEAPSRYQGQTLSQQSLSQSFSALRASANSLGSNYYFGSDNSVGNNATTRQPIQRQLGSTSMSLGQAMGGFGGRGVESHASQVLAVPVITVQAVGDKTFYLQHNNVWQDQSYDPKKQKLVAIQAFSDAHFALLKAFPKLAAYSSVGDEVIVRLGKTAIQVGKTGKEKLTDAELKELTTP
jgi:Ca-activated chloride channel family protein